MPPATTSAVGTAAQLSGAYSVFVQDETAVFAPLVAAGVKKHHEEQLQANSASIITTSYTAFPAADIESVASAGVVDAIDSVIDRVYEYESHFKLDEPFTIRLHKGETVLLPLEPIHDLLFPLTVESSAGPADSTTQENEQAASPFAIGLELSNCQGRLQSFILRDNNRASRFSTANYQCVTISHASKAQQQHVNLCPHYDPRFPVALYENPLHIKGFLLRADIDEPVESIVLLRSTKSSGGFEKAFVVPDPDDDDKPTHPPFNVSFSYEATTLGFESPSIWDHSNDTTNESLLSSELQACEACEYFLYAEKIASNQSVHTVAAGSFVKTSSAQLALPYCIRQRSSIQYQLPKSIGSTSSSSSDEKTHHNVKLDDLFADHFRSNGEYRFVLMASLPSSSNHQHPAMLAYAPQQLFVKIPPFYQSHFFIAFVVVALFAVAAILHVQYQPHRPFFSRKTKPSASDAEDEAEFVSLLARSASAVTTSPRGEDVMDALEEGLLAGEHDADDDSGDDLDTNGGVRTHSSLLDAIKRTKEQQPAAVELDGYHEIN